MQLSPAEALRENGFTVFRGLIPPDECARLAATIKADAGITEGKHFTRTDATIKVPSTRAVLFDERVVRAVREAVDQPVRFLQHSDLHYRHDTGGWHRDSVHRQKDASNAADWTDGQYGVVKAILYLESGDAGMGMVAGTHLSPRVVSHTRIKAMEKLHLQLIIDADRNPNERLAPWQRFRPLAWRAFEGDLLVFDQRMFHCGRRVNGRQVGVDTGGRKMTLSLAFGPENHHTWRFYSYMRYVRKELGYKPIPDDYRAQLAERDLLLNDLGNYYVEHPEEVRLAHLRHPETMEQLVADFSAQRDRTSTS